VLGVYPSIDVTPSFQIDQLRQWLQQCQSSHAKCQRRLCGSELPQFSCMPLPTRCIEKVSGTYYLRETSGQDGLYIALSHRWTEATGLCCLTAGNLEDRTAGRSFESITRVFQDAIDVAEQLGIRYVWIDSLCIIQEGDGMKDWMTESEKMADYYQQAYLTIFATSGTDECGLFPPLEQVQPLPRISRLPYRTREGRKAGFFYLYEYNASVNDAYRSAVVNSDLFTRGWVYQEWFLSRRTVCYTPWGMFFSCVTRPPENDRGDCVTRPGFVYSSPMALKTSLNFNISVIDFLWYRIIEGYSSLQLTRPSEDRLAALVGIADEVRAVFGQ
jgi:hypothetical protein